MFHSQQNEFVAHQAGDTAPVIGGIVAGKRHAAFFVDLREAVSNNPCVGGWAFFLGVALVINYIAKLWMTLEWIYETPIADLICRVHGVGIGNGKPQPNRLCHADTG